MFNNLQTEEDLDEATRKFHDVTNRFMNEVAPFKTINYPGRWRTPGLQQEIWDINNERERLKRKGKKATKGKWKNWRRQRRLIYKKIRNMKGEALE